MNLSDTEWGESFHRRIAAQRVPLSGLLELTSRCSLRCVHCYLGPQDAIWPKGDEELTTAEVIGIVDQLVEAGCLYLSITGGDPMVRPDFAEIYTHARKKGLLVTILCNGILVKEPIVELFKRYPPTSVEISLYGATAETYEAITKVKGSYAKCLEGIRRLVEADVRVRLKTVHLTLNTHELGAMRELAASFGLGFRTDSAIFPFLPDRDPEVLKLRVTPEQAVASEIADPGHLKAWGEHLAKTKLDPLEEIYVCGAGVTDFYIDPYGYASPCLMTTQYRHSLRERTFASLWATELRQHKGQKPQEGYGCNSCDMRGACTGCPAFNYLENGEEDVKSDYVCKTTELRWNEIQKVMAGEATAPPAGGGAWRPITLSVRRKEPPAAPKELVR
jgi:radical SAM protein with 4Fe4S-binding SPASM domain